MSNFRVDASGQQGISVTPNDTTAISHPPGDTFTKGLYVGVTGNISVLMAGGATVIFTNISAGVIHPISAIRVNATGTTATGIIAIY